MAYSESDKLRKIDLVISRWLEPHGGLTSYQAMMEVVAAMDAVPPAIENPSAEAEYLRWEQDRPHEHEPAPAPEKIRAKSSFLG
jgi:hypothetical protein